MAENKPIMVDGCDVSGCEFYNTDDGTCREVNGRYDTDICEFDKCKNSNCCFKQLALKKQECRKLNLKIIEIKAMNETLKNECVNCKEIPQLKAAKEQAEQKIEQIRQILKNGVKIHDDIIVNKSILQIIDEVE